jgi:hypothetical protein
MMSHYSGSARELQRNAPLDKNRQDPVALFSGMCHNIRIEPQEVPQ